eukprot:6173767-Pleurochrysis_carterae.AAC.3
MKSARMRIARNAGLGGQGTPFVQTANGPIWVSMQRRLDLEHVLRGRLLALDVDRADGQQQIAAAQMRSTAKVRRRHDLGTGQSCAWRMMDSAAKRCAS